MHASIVPCKNERGNIDDIVARTPDMGKGTELIFVDGNSNDGTVEEIEKHIEAGTRKNMRLIHQGDGKGKGDAVRKGFAAATGDVLFILDADLTVPPEDLPKFYAAIAEGKAEFVNGSRLVYPMEGEAMRFLNSLGNKFFGLALSAILEQRLKDTLCGTKVLFRRDYERIAANRGFFGDFDPFGDFDLLFGAAKQNLKIVELPIRYRARTYGETKISRFREGAILGAHDAARVPQVQGAVLIAMRQAPLSAQAAAARRARAEQRGRSAPLLLSAAPRPRLRRAAQHRAAPARRALRPHARDRLRLGPAHADAGLGLRRALRRSTSSTSRRGCASAWRASACAPRELVQADARSMPFADGFFDVVVAFSIFEHLRAARARRRRSPRWRACSRPAAASSSAARRCTSS